MKEIIGYIGAAVFVVSSTLTSIRNYRLYNVIGSVICLIYGVLINAIPIVVLMTGLAAINLRKYLKPRQEKLYYDVVEFKLSDTIIDYLLDYYKKDIKKFFPQYRITDDINYVKVSFHDGKPVGIFCGIRKEDALNIVVDYVIPKYRDGSCGDYLMASFSRDGIKEIRLEDKAVDHDAYLRKMGFVKKGSTFIKTL